MTSAVIDAARKALLNIELARVNHFQPVNGSYDYFTVTFAGATIMFRLPWHDDNLWLGGEYSCEIGKLSNKAAACATAINDLLFDVAKRAAASAIEAPSGGETTEIGSTEGESATRQGDAR